MKILGNNWVSQNVIPGIYSLHANKELKKRYDEIEELMIKDFTADINVKESIAQVTQDIINQSERKKGLEDKLKAILFAAAIAMTAITFVLNSDRLKFNNSIDWIAFSILLVSVFYFISSALRSIQTLMPVPFHILQIDIRSDQENSIFLTHEKKQDKLKRLLKEKLRNDNINLRQGNLTYASLKLFRNGIILFGVYFLAAIFQKRNMPASGKILITDSLHIQFRGVPVQNDSATLKLQTADTTVVRSQSK